MHVATITIDHTKVAGDLTDYVVAVLNNSDAGWNQLYATATSGGGDIRVYKSGGVTELPREIVSFSVVGETGEIHIKFTGTLSGSVSTDIEIHADGTSSDYAVGATYGRNAVWSAYAFVSHDGGGVDSTGNVTTTAFNGVSAGDSTGKIGTATEFVIASGHYFSISSAAGFPSGNSNVSCSAWVNMPSVSVSTRALNFGASAGANPANVNQFTSLFLGQYTSSGTIGFVGFGNDFVVGSVLSASTWTKVGFTYAGSSRAVNLYRGGSSVSSGTLSLNKNTQTAAATISGRSYDTAERFGGLLDELRLTNLTLSANWESTEYNNQNSPTTFYSVTAESGAVTVTPAAQVATFSLPAETVSTGTTVAANTQTATFSLPAESIIIATTATPAAQVATFSVPNFTIDAGGNITIVGGINTATFSLPQESILRDFVTQPSAVTATFSTPATTIAAGSGATVAPTAQVGTFSTPAPSISVEASVTVGVDTQLLTFSLPALQRVGGLWTKRPRATNADWLRRSVNDD